MGDNVELQVGFSSDWVTSVHISKETAELIKAQWSDELDFFHFNCVDGAEVFLGKSKIVWMKFA